MKKTILCAVTGGAVFILLYNILQFNNICISIAAALIAYFAMTLILSDKNNFREKDLSLENIENAAVIVKKCTNYVSSIKKIASAVNDKKLSSSIYEICGTLDKILVYIKDNPQQARHMRKFMQYYLPALNKILVQYNEIEDQRLTGEDSRQLLKNIADIVEKIKTAFENKLNELYAGEVMDTDAEIKVLDTMLKSDGLLKDADFTITKKKV